MGVLELLFGLAVFDFEVEVLHAQDLKAGFIDQADPLFSSKHAVAVAGEFVLPALSGCGHFDIAVSSMLELVIPLDQSEKRHGTKMQDLPSEYQIHSFVFDVFKCGAVLAGKSESIGF